MTLGPIEAIRIFAYDFNAAYAFYANTLDLDAKHRFDDGAIFETGQCKLILESVDPGDEEAAQLVGRFVGVSFTSDDITKDYDSLLKRGVMFDAPPQSQPWGGVLAHFRDPDDNVLTLVQYRPRQLGGGMHEHHGQCHCSALELSFRSDLDPADTPVRACQCSFCRKHNTRAVADPNGEAEIVVNDEAALRRYRFGLGTAEFLLCGRCGVYVAAVMDDGDRSYATLILNAFDDAERFTQPVMPVDYAAEDEAGRRARRRERWTPANIVISTR